jgi:hypothetical protein
MIGFTPPFPKGKISEAIFILIRGGLGKKSKGRYSIVSYCGCLFYAR